MIAYCLVGLGSDIDVDVDRNKPDECVEWNVQIDYESRSETYEVDPYFSVESGECAGTPAPISNDVPDTICIRFVLCLFIFL